MNTDMLSVKKVAAHGMQDSRWVTQDKITQYKGINNLYLRDQAVSGSDKTAQSKKYQKTISKAKKDIVKLKKDLQNAMFGDTQKIRNALAEERRLQLAYQDLHPSIITDHIAQNNFNLRKVHDKLMFKLGLTKDELILLKLTIGELEDRLTYEAVGKLPVEVQMGIVTGKVQDALLKMEAAITVQHTYRSLIQIMKRDSIYYEAVLKSIESDLFKQHICMKETIVMGQLAIENLDDRRSEFKQMEKNMKAGIKARLAAIEDLRAKVVKMSNNLRNLIRRDSDTNLIVDISTTGDDSALRYELMELDIIFKQMMTITKADTYMDIMPCLKAQVVLDDKLKVLLTETTAKNEQLLNKYNHAQLMMSSLESSVTDTLDEYKRSKQELLQNIAVASENKRKFSLRCEEIGGLITNMRAALQLIVQNCKAVRNPALSKARLKGFQLATGEADDVVIFQRFVNIETNPLKLIEILVHKLEFLEKLAPAEISTRQIDEANTLAVTLTTNRNNLIIAQTAEAEELSLLEDLVIDELGVLSRADIKKMSADIVRENIKNDDLVPMFESKKKSKLKKH